MLPKYFCAALSFLLLQPSVEGYRILSIFLITGRSNMNYFDPIHLALAQKGHEITVITPTSSLVKHPNIHEFSSGLDFSTVVQGMVKKPDFFQMRLAGERMGTPFTSMAEKFAKDCDLFHQLAIVQKVISGEMGKFDLVMTMAFMNECVYGIFHHLNASSIVISTVPTMPWFTGALGVPTPLSFVPHIYYDGSQEMGFLERLTNLGTFVYQVIARNWVFLPEIEKAYQKHLPLAPGVNEVLSNVSLIMGAGHPAFGPLRPSMPDFVDDIGGIHCRPRQPLPPNVRDLILNEDGKTEKQFIFFSLGSIVQGHQVPANILQAFLKTFAKFPEYRILWKWEASQMEGQDVPDNVRISKWFPQQDVLGHEKCKLFITHGGLSSLHESIYHSVPVIGIPFFGDQDWNMKQVEYHEIGRKLELGEISEEKLTTLLRDILETPKYMENMAKRSEIFRDRQVSALDKAVWKILYVLRHGGAPHLRIPARNMNFLQYYCLDLIAAVVLAFLVLILGIRKIVHKFCCHGEGNPPPKSKGE